MAPVTWLLISLMPEQFVIAHVIFSKAAMVTIANV